MLRLLAIALLLAVAPVAGSLIESESSGVVTYQFDGDTFHDAPDTCEELLANSHDFSIPMDNSTDGMVVPGDDEIDYFKVAIDPSQIGERVLIFVASAAEGVELGIDVQQPECGVSVSSPEAQPVPEPSTGPEPAPGQKQVAADTAEPAPVEPVECDDDHDGHGSHHQDKKGKGHHMDKHNDDCEQPADPCANPWTFSLSNIDAASAPATIHVSWTNGDQTDVAMAALSEGVATYHTEDNLDVTLYTVTANVPESWDGQFTVSGYSCGAEDGGAVFGDPSSSTQAAVSFTPVTSGIHIVSIRLLPPEAPTVPTSVPLSCHFCIGEAEDVADVISYIAGAQSQFLS